MSEERSANTERGALVPVGTAGLDTALIRAGFAAILLIHGLGRLGAGPRAFGPSVAETGSLLAAAGLPAPGLLATLVTLVEVGGGLFLFVGLLVRATSVVIGVQLFLAFVTVHLPAGWMEDGMGIELTGLLVLLSVAFVVGGSGSLSVVRLLFGGSPGEWVRRRLAG